MENQTNQNQDSAFWEFVINIAVVVAAGALYSKTQEVMTYLAPATLFGQQGLALVYGFGVAALIEGVTLALHFLKSFAGNVRAEGYKWFLFGVSTFCQFLDEALVKDISNRSEMESFFSFIALGIVPAIFFGLLWVKGGATRSGTRSRTGFIGIVPWFRAILYGSDTSKENTVLSVEPSEDVNAPLNGKAKTKKVAQPNP